MAKPFPWLFVGIAGIAATFLLTGKKFLSRLLFVPRGIKIDTTSLIHPVIYLKIGIQNPSSVSVKLNSLIGQLSAGGKTLASVSAFPQMSIDGNAESVVTLTVEPSLVTAISFIINLIGQGVHGLDFLFEGNANVNNIVVPVKTTFRWI